MIRLFEAALFNWHLRPVFRLHAKQSVVDVEIYVKVSNTHTKEVWSVDSMNVSVLLLTDLLKQWMNFQPAIRKPVHMYICTVFI